MEKVIIKVIINKKMKKLNNLFYIEDIFDLKLILFLFVIIDND